jgi:hypothetical protein
VQLTRLYGIEPVFFTLADVLCFGTGPINSNLAELAQLTKNLPEVRGEATFVSDSTSVFNPSDSAQNQSVGKFKFVRGLDGLGRNTGHLNLEGKEYRAKGGNKARRKSWKENKAK